MEHYTVGEADFALFHGWRDGMAVRGPLDRHLTSGLIARFTTGLKITAVPDGEASGGGFGEWRKFPGAKVPVVWTVETSTPLAALFEGGVQVASLLPVGAPLILLVRFFSPATGRWRMFQFHDCEVGPVDVGDASENMMQTAVFRAGWREELTGSSGGTLPPMVPRVRGVIEWRHLGRCIPCWYFNADDNSWTENPENWDDSGAEVVRYVSLEDEVEGVRLSYLAARTVATAAPVAGLAGVGIGWVDARALQVLAAGAEGLMLEPGWQLQEEAAEPITLPPSGRHWEQPQVVFRFLGRIYATLSHGFLCVPSLTRGMVEPFDFPIRLGRLVLLPDGAWVLPE